MLSRFLGKTGDSSSGSSGKRFRGSQEKGMKDLIKTSEVAENTEDLQQDAERRLYRHKMPEQERGFGDLLQNHKRGNKFPFVMVSTDEGPTYESRISYLQRFQAKMSKRRVNVPNRVSLHLIQEVEEVSFQTLLVKKVKQEFVLLRKAVIVVTPLTSLFDTYTDVKACIVDRRMRGSVVRQELLLSSNKDYTGEMSLDYSIPTGSLDKVFFCVSLETPVMNTGEQWASCQMELDFEESDYPQRPNFKPVLAVSATPASGLTKYDYNPMKMDLTIHNNHREKLMDMYLDGDLSRPSDPEPEKVGKLEYVQSMAPGKSALKTIRQGKEPEIGNWDAVRSRPVDRLPVDQQSIDVPEDPNDIPPSAPSSEDDEDVPLDMDMLRKLNHKQSKDLVLRKKSVGFDVKDI